MAGVALVTSNKGWLPNRSFFEAKGFKLVDQISTFDLMVHKFSDEVSPSFYNWEETAKEYSPGITVLKSDQYSFIEEAVKHITEAAEELNIELNVIELDTYEMAQQKAPTPFGVFTVIYEGEIIAYHPLTKNNFIKKLHVTKKTS